VNAALCPIVRPSHAVPSSATAMASASLSPLRGARTEKSPSPRRVADSVSASNGRVNRRASCTPAPAASTVTTAATATTSGALQLRRRDVQDQQPAADRGREQRRHREPTVVHVPTDPPGRRIGSDTPSSATRAAGGDRRRGGRDHHPVATDEVSSTASVSTCAIRSCSSPHSWAVTSSQRAGCSTQPWTPSSARDSSSRVIAMTTVYREGG
jgi:hypothetical protein